ncbi:MAG: endonuclease/exonuclease/phosphatase family protein [bacterium]
MPRTKRSWTSIAVAAVIAAGGGLWWTFGPGTVGEPETITIGSFNIYEFGKGTHAAKRDLRALADLLIGIDLVVLQEVGATGGPAQVQALRDSMNAALPQGVKRYKTPLITSITGNNERYAFIYRDPVRYIAADKNPSTSAGERWIRPDPNGDGVYNDDTIFNRVPAYMYFRAKNFDFVIATVHLMWTHLDQREAEVEYLRDWLRTFDPRGPEEDIILLGDFNRCGKYTGTDVEDMAFSKFLSDGWENHYRILFLEPLETWSTKYAGKDEESTTVAQAKALYDQILIDIDTEYEFGQAPAEYGKTIGVVPFDMTLPYEDMSHNSLKVAMSDHRPIWAKFRIDFEDDD